MTEPKVTFVGQEEVNYSEFQPFDLEQARRNQAAIPTGPHLWCLPILYGVDDPDAALDDMVCDSSNLLGFGSMMCILCQVPYDAKLRSGKCLPDLAGRHG